MSQALSCRALIPAWIFAALLSSPVWAQQKQPISISADGVKSRYVQQNVIDVDDAPGHQIRNYEIERTFSGNSQAVVDGERVIEGRVRGF